MLHKLPSNLQSQGSYKHTRTKHTVFQIYNTDSVCSHHCKILFNCKMKLSIKYKTEIDIKF